MKILKISEEEIENCQEVSLLMDSRKKTFSHLKYDLTIHIFSPGLYLYLLSFSHLKYDLTIHILLPT